MHSRVYRFLAADHARLDALLAVAVADPESLDREAYRLFRSGLLRHIAMEEKVLLPAMRLSLDASTFPEERQVRADHTALAALLVPTPTRALIATIRRVLDEHNPIEERPGGLYEAWERSAGPDVEACFARMLALPEVKVAPHADGPRVHASIANLLRARVRE